VLSLDYEQWKFETRLKIAEIIYKSYHFFADGDAVVCERRDLFFDTNNQR